MTSDPNYRGLFEWAINALHQNVTITRAFWKPYGFGIRLHEGVIMQVSLVSGADEVERRLTTADLLARDWGVA